MLTCIKGRIALATSALGLFTATAAYALYPSLAPSGNFDLTHWYLTLPSAQIVDPITLSNGYLLQNVFYTYPNWGGMTLRCPNLAGTTTNTHYSRTELREVLNPLDSSYIDDSLTMRIGVSCALGSSLSADKSRATTVEAPSAARSAIAV